MTIAILCQLLGALVLSYAVVVNRRRCDVLWGKIAKLEDRAAFLTSLIPKDQTQGVKIKEDPNVPSGDLFIVDIDTQRNTRKIWLP